jgi:hypothetical protein
LISIKKKSAFKTWALFFSDVSDHSLTSSPLAGAAFQSLLARSALCLCVELNSLLVGKQAADFLAVFDRFFHHCSAQASHLINHGIHRVHIRILFQHKGTLAGTKLIHLAAVLQAILYLNSAKLLDFCFLLRCQVFYQAFLTGFITGTFGIPASLAKNGCCTQQQYGQSDSKKQFVFHDKLNLWGFVNLLL